MRLSATYVEALESAGLVPLIVPPLADPHAARAILDAVDGLVLTGGEDVNPALFGEKPHPKLKMVNDRRDITEIALVLEAQRRRIPTLGICRGIQLVNVALGGSLIQDIPSECVGARDHDDGSSRQARSHEIVVEPASRTAAAIAATKARVNSLHHQAVKNVAPGLRVTARSEDGIIEGLEADDPDWWLLTVQWHPEEMTDSPEPWDRGLFRAFAGRLEAQR